MHQGAYTGARPVSLVGTSVSIPNEEVAAKVRDNAIRFYDSIDEDEDAYENEFEDGTCTEDSWPSDYDVPEAECLRKTFKMYHNKNPLLCPVARMIAVGLHRNAFAASSIRSAEAILRSKRKTCIIFRRKEAILKEPMFREPARNKGQVTSVGPVEPLRPQTAARYLKRLGRDVGLEQSLTQSCIRRGTGNAVDSAGTIGERDQVMGHSHSGIFQFYINPNVKCDFQAAFLDEPSDDVLVKMLGNMSLTRDRLAPTRLGPDDARAIEEHPTVARLRLRRDASTDTLKRLRRGFERGVDEGKRYFMGNDTRELDEEDDQLLEDEAKVKSGIVYALEERARITDLLSSPVVDLDEPGALDRRIELIRLIKELCGRREVRRRGTAPNPTLLQTKKEGEDVAFAPPLECDARQCLFCIGDEPMPVSQRMFCYSRPAKMMDHIEKDHLDQFEAEAKIPCPHPTCRKDRVVLDGVLHFKAHAQGVHKITLRLPKAARF
ncbi:FluG domain-containing protein [Paraphaeosphaeria sporulosa]